jgi:hypothetical protein
MTSDTGEIQQPRRGRGRPFGTTYDAGDTGPHSNIRRSWAAEPHLPFATVARPFVPDGFNAGPMVSDDSIIRRWRRSYFRWLRNQEFSATDLLSED